MKQANEKQLETSAELLKRLKEARGGSLGDGHKQIANDPALLKAFTNSYIDCCSNDKNIPEKYRQMIFMALCSARGYGIAINHGFKAVESGATIEELGEVIRMVLNVCGCPAILPLIDLFEVLDLDV